MADTAVLLRRLTLVMSAVSLFLWAVPCAEASGRHLLRTFAEMSSQSAMVPDTFVETKYPFLVQVRAARGSMCSGALIDPVTVLTAGHCVPRQAPKGEWGEADFLVTARAGAADSAQYTASRYMRHPGWEPAQPPYAYVNNDVAVIRLDQCADAPSYARLPCGGGRACNLPGNVYSYGWGKVDDDPASVPYRVRRSGPYQTGCGCTEPGQMPEGVEETFFCLYQLQDYRYAVQQICQGDSGGPVLLEAPQGMVALGINSFGDGASCGSEPMKNAGYIADLTNPSINSWVCQFVQGGRRQKIMDACPNSKAAMAATYSKPAVPAADQKAPTGPGSTAPSSTTASPDGQTPAGDGGAGGGDGASQPDSSAQQQPGTPAAADDGSQQQPGPLLNAPRLDPQQLGALLNGTGGKAVSVNAKQSSGATPAQLLRPLCLAVAGLLGALL